MGSEIKNSLLVFTSVALSPKHEENEFEQYRKGMGKQNIRKSRVSYIFCEKQKSMQFPKHGESEFQQHEKHEHFKFIGFLNIEFPKYGKIGFLQYEKSIEKHKHFKFMGFFLIFCVKQKSVQFPKHGVSGFPQYGESMGKHKHSKVMSFSNILGEAKIHTILKTLEK